MNFKDLNLSLPTLDVLHDLGLEEYGHTAEEWRGRCPFHESSSRRSRSFAVSIHLRKWFCHKCKDCGDLIDLYALLHQCSCITAANRLKERYL